MHRRSDPLSLSLHVASFSVRIFNQLDLKNLSLISYYFMQWVSHRNHRGNICGVDFIWLLNPNKYRKLLKTSWSQAVFGMFKYQLRRASLTEEDAFAFLKADSSDDYISYSDFCEALRQLSLIGNRNGLSIQETNDLWVQADIDGNGVVDYKEFKVFIEFLFYL
nr:uncharacterized calcium-binding protein At1g02270 [Ipomoea batatas]